MLNELLYEYPADSDDRDRFTHYSISSDIALYVVLLYVSAVY